MFLVPRAANVWIRAFIAVLVVLGSWQVMRPLSAQEVDPEPDLAVMTLNPLDLSAIDMNGFGINDGLFADGATVSAQLTSLFGGDNATFADALGSNGFVDSYTLELNQAKVLGDPTQGLTQVVTSSVLEFDDEAGATAAYDLIATTDTIPGSTDVSAQLSTGFAAQGNIVPSAGFAPVNGVAAFQQSGRHIAIVIMVPAADATSVAPLIDRVVEKIGVMTVDGGPDLGKRALRLIGPSVAQDRGFYSIGWGAPLRVVTQFDEEFERFTTRNESVDDAFQQVQVVTATDGTRLQIRTFVASFESEDEASAWLEEAETRQGQLTPPEQIEPDPDFPDLGDESTSFTYSLSGGNGVRQATIRVGTNVVVIDMVSVESSTPPGRILLDELGRVQADCLASFCEPQEPPTSFSTGIVATPRTDEATPVQAEPTETEVVDATIEPTAAPAGEATAEATAEATTDAVVAPPVSTTPDAATPGAETGDAIASEELYGIQVAYDSTVWQPVGTLVDGTRSSFDLTNGVSTVSFVGDTKYAGDPRSCLDDALVYLETTVGAVGITEILDAAGNSTIVVTDQAAQGLYKYTDSNGTLLASFVYCITLTPGSTTFLAIGTSPGPEFTGQFPIMVELIQKAQVNR